MNAQPQCSCGKPKQAMYHIACPVCWAMVPAPLQTETVRLYKTARGTDAHLEAVRKCFEVIRAGRKGEMAKKMVAAITGADSLDEAEAALRKITGTAPAAEPVKRNAMQAAFVAGMRLCGDRAVPDMVLKQLVRLFCIGWSEGLKHAHEAGIAPREGLIQWTNSGLAPLFANDDTPPGPERQWWDSMPATTHIPG